MQSEYFSRLSVPPVICAARCAEGLDDRGDPTLDVSIHCTVHGVDKVRLLERNCSVHVF